MLLLEVRAGNGGDQGFLVASAQATEAVSALPIVTIPPESRPLFAFKPGLNQMWQMFCASGTQVALQYQERVQQV